MLKARRSSAHVEGQDAVSTQRAACVIKDSPLFLARYWVRKPDLHFEEGEYDECEVNGEGFRFVVPASGFVVAEQPAKRRTRNRARHPKASPKRVLSAAVHRQIKEVLRA